MMTVPCPTFWDFRYPASLHILTTVETQSPNGSLAIPPLWASPCSFCQVPAHVGVLWLPPQDLPVV